MTELENSNCQWIFPEKKPQKMALCRFIPQCKPSDLPEIENGYLHCETEEHKGIEIVPYGNSCKYKCNKGFAVDLMSFDPDFYHPKIGTTCYDGDFTFYKGDWSLLYLPDCIKK